ncbi:MAG: tetratricopeptide repeat protein [Chitinispirillales bacterium]|jgi:tetratricopeptide (TPR) repeat protein|nr:tetratricopeptide repeat protein [Chitinispirillales bacterium]
MIITNRILRALLLPVTALVLVTPASESLASAGDSAPDSADLVEVAEFTFFGYSSEGANVQVFVNATTKDSVVSVIYFGEMGKSEYRFIFNKRLSDAAVIDYTYTGHITDSNGKIASIEKSTLKTSKEANRELTKTFLEIRKELAEGIKDGTPVKRGFEALDDGDKATVEGQARYYYDLAVTKFSHAIRMEPQSAVAHAGRGRAYLRKGDNKQAAADFSEAIRLNPKDAISMSNRGRAYARMGDYSRAVADFEAAAKIEPGNELIKQNLERARRHEKGL